MVNYLINELLQLYFILKKIQIKQYTETYIAYTVLLCRCNNIFFSRHDKKI